MKKAKRFLAVLFSVALCFACSISSFAVEKPKIKPAVQSVKVSQEIVNEQDGKTSEDAEKIECEYKILGHQSSSGHYPMPETPSFKLKGNDSKELEIEFSEEGIYEYTLVRECALSDVKIPEDRIRYFGFKVDDKLNVTPYTCTDPDAEIEEHLSGISLTNTIYVSEKKKVSEEQKKVEQDKKKDKKTIKERVQTNDPFNIAMWIIILVAAAVAIVVIIRKKKKTDDKEEK